ncbi:FAD-dependent oxidoreductase [Nocardiopsis sp. RSe5-2]|uniref:FAD-dependent oxidoreductase n=1 Tax=Nocardiopsis endophytica TaxID=3018445 RepID=A0ABT4U5X5_9ACTN|nr:FAD-dependent oxidoreductase [Nocardiopsis endophytica]MDA2812351.1 FAD-dependent oxidoreductase [Nocardiopsis endophytica]
MTETTQAVVIGGGYAGVMAANRLAGRKDVAVTLVNPRPGFVERIRLHQHAGGGYDAFRDYRDVLAPGVRTVVGTVERIDAAECRLTLAGGAAVDYDRLVYAVGSGSAAPDVPGAAEYALPLASLEEAQRLRTALQDAPESAPVTVVGAGPTGIEAATELAEQGRRVTLVCGKVMGPYLHRRGRRTVARRMAELGVTVLQGPGATVVEVAADAVRLDDGREVPSRVTVWTAGFAVPDLAARSGLSTDEDGRLLTDETLTSVDDERIVAAGDSAAPSGMPLRMSCQAALPLGARAADTVLGRIDGERPAPLNQAFAGQCISLGRQGGIFQFSRRHDVAVGLHIRGRLGATVKEKVCLGTVRHMADEARAPGSYRLHKISGGPERARRLRAVQAMEAPSGTASAPAAARP